MRHLVAVLMLSLCLMILIGVPLSQIAAQSATPTPVPFRPQQGDPPVAERISISPPDTLGIVTITGQANSVFPNAHLVIRNLYTEETIYLQAGVGGAFNARIRGEGNTPFWISPAIASTPLENRGIPGSLPGGPGTILVAPYPSLAQPENVTRIAVDGILDDWRAYPTSGLTSEIFALHNQNSLLIAVNSDALRADSSLIRAVVTINTSTFSVTVDPRNASLSSLRRINPNQADLAPLLTAAIVRVDESNSSAEVRIPLSFVDTINRLSLDEVSIITPDESVIDSYSLTDIATPFVEETDAVFRPEGSRISSGIAFALGGALGDSQHRRVGVWSANGQVSDTNFDESDGIWRVEMDVRLLAALPANVRLIAQMSLQPIVREVGGEFVSPMTGLANNGWSSVRLGALPVDNVIDPGILLGEIVAEPGSLIRFEDETQFRLDASFDAAALGIDRGLYVPVIEGYIEVDGVREPWTHSMVFDREDTRADTPDISRMTQTRLPFVLNVGAVESARLPVALFYDEPSDGSRGVLAQQDAERFTLSNRVRLNAPTYILPPFRDGSATAATYSLEPYLLNVMPNLYDSTAAPLIPFDFDTGTITLRVTKPDGTVEDFGEQAVVQSMLSTFAQDERARFGAQSPVDVYRLTTLNPALMRYAFDQYGDYTIDLTLTIEDMFGNAYEGGGTYTVVSAEPIDLNPIVLHGTPFRMGDVFNSGINITPGVPADVTVTLSQVSGEGRRIFSQSLDGTANTYGYFIPDEAPHRFAAPGVYIVDYNARYTDVFGRLWAGSARSAGVVADDGIVNAELTNTFVAHGERGLRDTNGQILADARLAWFDTENVLAEVDGIINFPYFSGDVAWIADSPDSGLWAVIRAQDIDGRYQTALRDRYALEGDNTTLDVARMLIDDEAPVNLYTAEQGYTVINAVRPGITARSFVAGGDYYGDPAYDNLPMWWDADDPYNGQLGAGITGDRPGDYTFLFGGVVLSDTAMNIQETAIYASLAVVTTDNDPRGERVYPPLNGSAGSGNGGALIALDDREFDAFFVPTGVIPGSVLVIGDTFSVVGQAAPTLDALVQVTVTAPSGDVRSFEGRANPIGYFYDPAQDFPVGEVGVWTVNIRTVYDGLTSAGQVEPPYVEGSLLSISDDSFYVYILPDDAEVLDSNIQLGDTLIPVGTPYNFSFTVPPDWQDTRAFYTVSTPQFILANTPVNLSGRSFSYQWSPSRTRGSFPMIENEPRGVGNAVTDPITLTFAATGTDANGQPGIRVRRFTLYFNRLVSGWSLQPQD